MSCGLDEKTQTKINKGQILEIITAYESEPCPSCKGRGVALGTDTEDKHGEPCGCGCDFQRPATDAEKADLQRLHDSARKKKGGFNGANGKEDNR